MCEPSNVNTLPENQTLVSRSELGRVLNVPNSRLVKAEKNGSLVPDMVLCGGKVKLFDMTKAGELALILASSNPQLIA